MSTVTVIESSAGSFIPTSLVVKPDSAPLEKKTVRCENPLCRIRDRNQYRPRSGRCVCCRKPLPSSSEGKDTPVPAKVDVSPSLLLNELSDEKLHNSFLTGMAQAVREYRRVKHLSQRQLAAKAGLQRTWISKVECGATLPMVDSIEKIANGLGIDSSDLVASATGAVVALQLEKFVVDNIKALGSDAAANLKKIAERFPFALHK